jgi:hypothetical protein
MQSVFVLLHAYQIDGKIEDKLLGIFSSENNAIEVLIAAQRQPGFSDYPYDFYLYEYDLDQDYW